MSTQITVVMADDHALLRGTLRERLNREPDLDVVADVGNADEAVAEALRLRPDVVVMDVDMPGQDCFEAARDIARRCDGTAVIFLSAFFNDRYIEQAIAAGAAGYVTKTETADKVVEAIRSAAAGVTYYSPEVQMRIVVDDGGRSWLAPEGHTRLSEVSPREAEVLRYVAQGLSNKEIAGRMFVTVRTVEAHCSRLMNKLGIHGRVELARYAIREGLAEP